MGLVRILISNFVDFWLLMAMTMARREFFQQVEFWDLKGLTLQRL